VTFGHIDLDYMTFLFFYEHMLYFILGASMEKWTLNDNDDDDDEQLSNK